MQLVATFPYHMKPIIESGKLRHDISKQCNPPVNTTDRRHVPAIPEAGIDPEVANEKHLLIGS